MAKIKKSEYIKLSRTLIKKLYDETCFGKGSLYIENLKGAYQMITSIKWRLF